MNAVKIYKKTDMYKVLRACRHVAGGVASMFPDIYYHAESQEIFATNGKSMLIYRTDEIETLFGQASNGVLHLEGQYLIFEDYEGFMVDYQTIVSNIKPSKRLIVDWRNDILPADVFLVEQCAVHGIQLAKNVVKPVPELECFFKELILQTPHSKPVALCGDSIKYIISPIRDLISWKETECE